MKKFFFLDVANTLLHKPGILDGWLEVLQGDGHEVDREMLRRVHKLVSELVEFPDRTSKSFYEEFNAKILISLGLEPNPLLLEKLFSRLSYAAWEPFEDTQYLKSIDQPLGIISNWDRSLVSKLEIIGLSFNPIVGSEELGFKKPHPDIFKAALSHLGESYDQIYYVGDSIQLDMIPARKAGLIPILIDRYDDYPYFKGMKIASFQPLMSF